MILVVDTSTEKVSMVVYTSYHTEKNRAASPAQEARSDVKIFDKVKLKVTPFYAKPNCMKVVWDCLEFHSFCCFHGAIDSPQ